MLQTPNLNILLLCIFLPLILLGHIAELGDQQLIFNKKLHLISFKTVKIICDTSADLNLPGDKTLYKDYKIDWVPMQVMFGTNEYKELETLKTSDFYEKLSSVEQHPITSQATQHDLLKKYEEFGEKFDEIISVHLSSKISGAVANNHMAKKCMKNPIQMVLKSSSMTV